MKRYFASFLAFVLLMGVTACGTSTTSPDSAPPTTSISNAPTVTLITDEAVLRELWYYLEKSPPLLNEAVEDLSTLTAASTTTAAITIWSRTNDIATLPPVEIPSRVQDSDKTKQGYLWTLEQATEQVERTFGMKLADPEGYFAGMAHKNSYGPYYLPEVKGIAFMEEGPWESDAAYGEPSWGYTIDNAVDNGDGTVTATLSCMDDRMNKVSNTAAFVLGKHNDGGYYYKTVHEQYNNNNAANPRGSYRTVEATDGLELGFGLSGMRLLWQDGDSVLLVSTSGRAKQDSNIEIIQLLRVNTKTAKLEKLTTVETQSVPKESNYLKVRGTANGIVVSSRYDVRLYDHNLALTNTSPLSDSLTAKMIETVRTTTPEGHTIDKEFFEDFAVAADGSLYCYSNHKGLFVVDTATGSEKLIVPSHVSKDSLIVGTIATPRDLQFVESDSKLVYNWYNYSGVSETICIDLATGVSAPLPAAYMAAYGSAGVASTVVGEDYTATITYADYATGKLRSTTLKLPDLDPASGLVGTPYTTSSNRNYLLSVFPIHLSEQDSTTHSLYRVSLADMSAQQLDFAIDVELTPVGITDEGTAIISYYYSPAEYGILLLD